MPEALRRAQDGRRRRPGADADYARLANVLGDMDRHAEAAAAYGEAIARRQARRAPTTLWTLHLLRAASLEQADRWAEAKAELEAALKLGAGQSAAAQLPRLWQAGAGRGSRQSPKR